MINFDGVDFSERRPEEVISFFWRSVYVGILAKIWKQISKIINYEIMSTNLATKLYPNVTIQLLIV